MAKAKLVLTCRENVESLLAILEKMKAAGFTDVEIETPVTVIREFLPRWPFTIPIWREPEPYIVWQGTGTGEQLPEPTKIWCSQDAYAQVVGTCMAKQL